MTRALFVARNRYRLPLSPSLRLKWDALARVLDVRVVAASADRSTGDATFKLRPRTAVDGPRFWLSLPARIRREANAFAPDAIVAQSPFEGAAALVARTGVPVIVELHGDWRTFGRLYGSPARRLIARGADAVGTWAVRHAAKVRAVSPYTERLAREIGREPAATFPAFMDLDPFLVPPAPLPQKPVALFVGVLEAYKNIDGLAEAWRRARPAAELRIVGKGTRVDVVESLVRDGLATWTPELTTEEVVRAIDDASALVLPSRSEGMGRVVIEAHLRGRPVLGSRVGGIPDLVTDGVDGLLFEPTPDAIAQALRVLDEPDELARLAAAARAAGERWLVAPDVYAARMAELAAP
ncbi:MAG TPA: glycosyltransferase family 4 protein [Gaiellaceae bacterium]|nr:glycosyltransferase family 4 protein [Gaiellaceae bacterium]